jgi:hypothetical protein
VDVGDVVAFCGGGSCGSSDGGYAVDTKKEEVKQEEVEVEWSKSKVRLCKEEARCIGWVHGSRTT